jgi:putative ABC transport system permease protein
MNDAVIVLRSMRARLFSTTTTICMVAIAVALMLVLITLQAAGRQAFQRGTGNMHLLVSGDASPVVAVLNGIFYANAPRRALTWAQYEDVKGRAPFEYAIPTQFGDSYRGLPVLATTREFFEKFQPNPGEAWELAEGEYFDAPFEVVVGAAAAVATGLGVGDEIFIAHGAPQSRLLGDPGAIVPHVHEEFPYRVVGILAPTGGSHDRALMTDLTSSWIIHAHDRRVREDRTVTTTTEADLAAEDRLITGIYLRLVTREGSDTPANLPQVFDALRRDAGLTVAQPRQEIDRLFVIVGGMNRLFVAIAACVLVSSAVGILLALYNSMEQRRQQVAILRVLGASRGRVFGLVTAESVVIGFVGSLAGIAVAAVAAGFAADWLRVQVGVSVGAVVDPRTSVGLIMVTVALAGLAGVIPAARAYMTPVAKSLAPSAG